MNEKPSVLEGAPPSAPRWKLVVGRLRKPVVAVAAIGTVLGGLAGYLTLYRTVIGKPPAAAEPAQATKVTAPISVLVLPLANHTGDASKAYIADGLTTALTADLSRITDAVVVPPLHAVVLQQKGLALDRLGSEAGVRFVLQGAVTGNAERLRVTAQLMDTQSARQLWSKSFETTTTDLYEVQDDLTQRIRLSVGSRMVSHVAEEALQRRDRPQVADLLLRARALDLVPATLARMEEQEALARQALAIEPTNRRAKSALARSLWLHGTNFNPSRLKRDAGRLMEEAERHATELLASDPEHTVALNVLAEQARRRLDFDGARKLYERLLAIDARQWSSYNNLSVLYLDWGEPERARELLLKALALPSHSPPDVAFGNLSRAAIQLGQYDDAIRWAERAVAANPDVESPYMRLAVAHALMGDEKRARAAGAELLRRFPQWRYETARERPWLGKEQKFEAFMAEKFRPALRLAGLPVV